MAEYLLPFQCNHMEGLWKNTNKKNNTKTKREKVEIDKRKRRRKRRKKKKKKKMKKKKKKEKQQQRMKRDQRLVWATFYLGVCAGRIGRVNANISIQSATSGLEKFQSATNPPKSKSGRLITNFGGFNSTGYAG